MSEITIEPCQSSEELASCFDCFSSGFGQEQPLLNALYPDHDTLHGRQQGIARLQANWEAHRHDDSVHFLKAVVHAVDGPVIAGFAIWALMTPERNLSDADADKAFDLNMLYPGKPQHQQWLRQVWHAYVQPRVNVIMTGSETDQRPVMVLELCVVHRDYQRRGIGVRLTQWGIDKARQVGAREAIVEASVPGVGCYTRCGFGHGQPIDFSTVERELRTVRRLPDLVFMRTGSLTDHADKV